MRSRLPQFALGVSAALVVVALSLLPDGDVIARAIIALPLVLVLPGYAIVTAAFPGRSLTIAERAALSVGLSLAVTVVGGLVLNWMPWGLRAGSWIVWLGGITLAAWLVALARRHLAENGRAAVVAHEDVSPLPVALAGARSWRARDLVGFTLAGLIAASACWAAVDGARAPREQFTQFWLLPSGGDGAVKLGMRSNEPTTTNYIVSVLVDGNSVLSSEPVTLEPGGRWEATLGPTTAGPSDGRYVEAMLYRADDPGVPYRRAVLHAGGAPVVGQN